MSIINEIKKGAKQLGSAIVDPWGIASKTYDVVTDAYHRLSGVPTSKERRNQARDINDQIKAYKEQTNLAREELNQKRAAEVTEKRRINEKQIRSLRNTYRSRGLLGGEASADEAGMTSKLGG